MTRLTDKERSSRPCPICGQRRGLGSDEGLKAHLVVCEKSTSYGRPLRETKARS